MCSGTQFTRECTPAHVVPRACAGSGFGARSDRPSGPRVLPVGVVTAFHGWASWGGPWRRALVPLTRRMTVTHDDDGVSSSPVGAYIMAVAFTRGSKHKELSAGSRAHRCQ